MPYRLPAENEEAKLDVEEVAAFQRVIAKKTWRQRGWLALTIVLLVGGVFAGMFLLRVRGQRTVGGHPGCHVSYVIHVDNVGAHSWQEEVLECGDASIPYPGPN